MFLNGLAQLGVINQVVSLISHYYLLNNEGAKHNDKMEVRYLEFLMYQTGIFIRMLMFEGTILKMIRDCIAYLEVEH